MSYVVFLIVLFILIMTGGIIALLRYQRARKEKIFSDKVLFLKTYGEEIKIDFKDCVIVHRDYFDETSKTRKDISIVTYHAEINGRKILFKTLPVFLPEEELEKYITKQKRTSIYYNPSDPEIYFFDVDFLLAFMVMS